MSDLLRPTDKFKGEVKRLVVQGALVPVEPVGTLTVNWYTGEYNMMTVDVAGTYRRIATDLPPGEYLIVPNEDGDPDWERDHDE